MTMNSGFDREVHFEIVEQIGVISDHSTGWKKELNLVRWNGGQPKYDIRDWSPDHEHMSRGVTLHEKEMRHIFELLKQRRQRERNSRPPGNGGYAAAPPASAPSASVCNAEPVVTSPPSPAPAPPPEPPQQCEDDFDDMEISEDGEIL